MPVIPGKGSRIIKPAWVHSKFLVILGYMTRLCLKMNEGEYDGGRRQRMGVGGGREGGRRTTTTVKK
jgi:hypothetical protein